jgi:N-acetylmuramoyl-L-alanine amidase
MIEDIDARARAGNTVVTIRLSAVTSYTVGTLDPQGNLPYRVYVDLEGTRLGPGTTRERSLETGPLARIRTGQFTQSAARVVLDFKEQAPFTVRSERSPFRIVLSVGEPSAERRRERRSFAAREPAPEPRDAGPSRGRPAVADTKGGAVAKRVTPVPGTAQVAAAEKAPPQVAPRTPAPAQASPPVPVAVAQSAQPIAQPAPPGPAVAQPAPPAPAVAAEAPTAPAAVVALPPPSFDPTAPERVPPSTRARGRQTPRHPLPRPARFTRAALIPAPALSDSLRVVIDPGHGGRDPGARSIDGAWEKDIVLGLARSLAQRLRERLAVSVVLTRRGDDTVPIRRRAGMAKGATLLVSVHANACPETWVEGVQTFYSDGGDHTAESRRLARLVHHRVVGAIDADYGPVRDGGVWERPLGLLRLSGAPSLLIETAYLSNAADRRRLDDPDYQLAVIDGIVDGIADYLAGVPDPMRLLARR